MQSLANNYLLSVACSAAAWFVAKSSCRFFFSRFSGAYRGGLPSASAAKQRTPAVETQQQQDVVIKRNQRRFLTYVVSTFNALISGVGALAFMKSSNWNPNSDNELLVIGSRMMLMSMLGYFISDLVDILPEWRKHKDELVHHLFGIFLLASSTLLRGYTPWAPFVMVIELSTPFINIQTIMLKMGYPESHPVPSMCLKLFAVSFILLRVVYLPFVVYHLVFDQKLNPGGRFEPHIHKAVSASVVALQMLNVWWLWGALKKVVKSSGSAATEIKELLKDD